MKEGEEPTRDRRNRDQGTRSDTGIGEVAMPRGRRFLMCGVRMGAHLVGRWTPSADWHGRIEPDVLKDRTEVPKIEFQHLESCRRYFFFLTEPLLSQRSLPTLVLFDRSDRGGSPKAWESSNVKKIGQRRYLRIGHRICPTENWRRNRRWDAIFTLVGDGFCAFHLPQVGKSMEHLLCT